MMLTSNWAWTWNIWCKKQKKYKKQAKTNRQIIQQHHWSWEQSGGEQKSKYKEQTDTHKVAAADQVWREGEKKR